MVQHLNINYIHVETPQVENYNNNDYEQFKSQLNRHIHFSPDTNFLLLFKGERFSIKSFPLSQTAVPYCIFFPYHFMRENILQARKHFHRSPERNLPSSREVRGNLGNLELQHDPATHTHIAQFAADYATHVTSKHT